MPQPAEHLTRRHAIPARLSSVRPWMSQVMCQGVLCLFVVSMVSTACGAVERGYRGDGGDTNGGAAPDGCEALEDGAGDCGALPSASDGSAGGAATRGGNAGRGGNAQIGGSEPRLPMGGSDGGEGGGHALTDGGAGGSDSLDLRRGVDLVSWNDDTIWVERSLGTSFATPVRWSNGLYYGNVNNLLGDVTGDGRADAVAWNANDRVYVLTSLGASFDLGAIFSDDIVPGGSRASALGDVNGDGKADLIAWSDNDVLVNLSKGRSFAAS